MESWRELVEIESYTHDGEAVKTLSSHIRTKLEVLGFEMYEYYFEKSGPLLIGAFGDGNITEGIILTGHMDTVFKTGVIKDHPFRVEGNHEYGPGVLDMNSAIVRN